MKSSAATEAKAAPLRAEEAETRRYSRGLPGNSFSALRHGDNAFHKDSSSAQAPNLDPGGDLQRPEVKVPSKSSVHLKRRRKNAKRRQAVSHAALRAGAGHGCESEVKAITSWVAPLSDL